MNPDTHRRIAALVLEPYTLMTLERLIGAGPPEMLTLPDGTLLVLVEQSPRSPVLDGVVTPAFVYEVREAVPVLAGDIILGPPAARRVA